MDSRALLHPGWARVLLYPLIGFFSVIILSGLLNEQDFSTWYVENGVYFSLLPVAGLLYEGWRRWRIARAERHLEAQSGTVLAAERGTVGGFPTLRSGHYICYPDVTVEYHHDGARYETSTFYPLNRDVRFKPDDADELLSEYEVGSETTVYVDQQNPEKAYLRPIPYRIWRHLLIIGALLLSFAILVFSNLSARGLI
jgi:hypothetical protein